MTVGMGPCSYSSVRPDTQSYHERVSVESVHLCQRIDYRLARPPSLGYKELQ